jgi:hypothetical protein
MCKALKGKHRHLTTAKSRAGAGLKHALQSGSNNTSPQIGQASRQVALLAVNNTGCYELDSYHTLNHHHSNNSSSNKNARRRSILPRPFERFWQPTISQLWARASPGWAW